MSFFMAGALCQEALEVLGVCPFISPVVIVVVVLLLWLLLWLWLWLSNMWRNAVSKKHRGVTAVFFRSLKLVPRSRRAFQT